MRHKLSEIMENAVLNKGELFEEEYSNLEIEVDCIAKIVSTTFYECIFYLKSNSNLILENCIFEEKVLFKGEHNLSVLTIRGSCYAINNLELTGEFYNIFFQMQKIISYKDTSECSYFKIEGCELESFDIKGKCDELNLRHSIFYSRKGKISKWDKIIRKSAECEKVVFENVEIDPFYLATKCADKSSLDLTGATPIDKWSYLRKKYAGINLFIVFFFTLIFFLPLITRSFLLLLMSKIDSSIVYLDNIYLWEALLFGGKEGWYAWGYCVLAIFLIVYNIGRFWITLSIAKLREQESFLSDSGFNLNSISPDKYVLQLKIDKCLNVMFWVTSAYSLLKLWDVAWLLVPNF